MAAPTPLPRSLRPILGLVLVAGLTLAAAAVATGRIGYHVTDGVSMEPTHHAGDLVVVAAADTYRAGDIVAYRGGRGRGVVVLHRILGGDASGYVIKGDNNQSVDPARPSAEELVGREVLSIPRVGTALRSPLGRALLLGSFLTLPGVLMMRRPTRHPSGQAPAVAGDRAGTARVVLVAVDVILVVALGLTFTPTDPPRRATPSAGSQTGALAYAAEVPVTDTYPTGALHTGDPVFLKLLREVDVTFRSAVVGAPGPVRGTARLDVEVTAANGWHTSLPMVPPTALADGALETTATLDLARIQALAASVAEETGLSEGTLMVTVQASTRVRVGEGRPVTHRFDLPFELTPLALTLSGVEPSGSPHGSAVTSTANLLPSTAPGDEDAGDGARRLRLGLLALLLLSGAATVAIWPGSAGAGPTDDHGPVSPHNAAAAGLRELKVDAQLAELTRLQLADRAALEALASALARLTGAGGRPARVPEAAADGPARQTPTGHKDL